jgi:hypothetical protein
MQISLALSLRNRRRLEYEVRQRRVDPADLVSALVADSEPLLLSLPVEPTSQPMVPMRVFFTPTQRDAFIAFSKANDVDLGQMVSMLLARYLEAFPDPPERPTTREIQPSELAAYRQELLRLQARRELLHDTAPTWLDAYIDDLVAFVAIRRDS